MTFSPEVDSALDVTSNNPVKNSAIAAAVNALQADIAQAESSAFPSAAKAALLACFEHVAWIDDDGQDYYDALYDALYNTTWPVTNTLTHCTTSNASEAVNKGSSYSATITASAGYALTGATVSITMGGTDITSTAYSNGTISIPAVTGALVISVSAAAKTVSSISAVYTQSGTVYDTDTLDSLKSDLVVTATYSDSSTDTVPSADYTLSGTLTAGTSTVTVSFGGKTTTFTVTVTAQYQTYDYIYTTAENDDEWVDTGLTYSPSWGTLNLEFEAMNSNTSSSSDALIGANNTTTSNKANILWYGRASKGGFSAYNLGVAKQLNTVPGDTRAVCKYFFVDGGESYLQFDSTTVAVATVSKSAITSNGKSLVLAGGYAMSGTGKAYGMNGARPCKLGYVKFTNPDNNAVLYNFVPAHDVINGKYGFFETVHSVFYPSNGSNFRCGNWED